MGQSRFEEVTFVRRGGNHGWNVWEGRHCYKAETCPEASLVPALWDYPRKQGQSITGGVVYRGRAFPELTGAFLAADFASGRLWALCSDGQELLGVTELADTSARVSHIGLGPDGEPMVVDYGGTLYQMVPRPPKGCP